MRFSRQQLQTVLLWLALSLTVLSAVGWFSVQQALTIDVGSPTARPYLSGFHAPEQLTAAGAVTYQWTEATASIRLPDAGWPTARQLSLRLIRFDAVSGPLLLTAGGLRAELGNELRQGGSARRYLLWLPPTDGVTLNSPLAATPAGDARELGNAIDSVSVQRPHGGLPAPLLLLAWPLLLLLHWRIAELAGLDRHDRLVGAAALLTAAVAALAVQPAALMLALPLLIGLAPALTLISLPLERLLRQRWPTVSGALTAALLFALFWKGLALGYPGFFATDSLFHAHRMAALLQGELFQTSVGGGTAFPYPLAGYIALLPAVLLSDELRWTLQIAALLLDATTVLLLAAWLGRAAPPRRIAHAAAIYVLLPVGFIQTFHNPVLHIVGQWQSLLYLTLLIAALRAADDWRRLWPLTLAALAASLGHFGIFLNLGLMMLTAFALQPRIVLARWRTLISYPLGVALSVLLFYSTAFDWANAQIGSGGEALQGTYGLASHGEIVRQVLLVYGLWDHYLVVFVPLGIWGVLRWWRATPAAEQAAPWLAAAMLTAGALIVAAVAAVLFSGTRYMAFIYAPLTLGSAYLTAEWAATPRGRWLVRVLFTLTAFLVLAAWYARFALNRGYWFLL
jgi:hypothetical protein